MKINKALVAGFLIAIIVLLFYVVSFSGSSLSGNTTDWGAFGSYIGIGISAITISLIYITYQEQRNSNIVARFEHHVQTLINTLNVLYEKHHEVLEKSYEKFYRHYFDQNYDLTGCEPDKAANVCVYYYSNILKVDSQLEDIFNYIFKYLTLSIDYILHGESELEDIKSRQMTEFVCILPESMRILFFCWLLNNWDDKLMDYYKRNLFDIGGTDTHLLSVVITFICSTNSMAKEAVSDNYDENITLALEENPDEQFFDTYEKIYKQKK